MKKPFIASQFIPTQWDAAEDKAKFANHLIRFIDSGFKQTLFYNWFYRRLSNTFGHIAHYNRREFFVHFFESGLEMKKEFIMQLVQWGCYGDPEYTYSDAEKAIQSLLKRRQKDVRTGNFSQMEGDRGDYRIFSNSTK